MIPDGYRDLLTDENRSPAYLATLMPDGTPQVTPVWFSYEEGNLRINTRRGRVKEKNLSARPAVAILIQDPVDTYRFLQIRGSATNATEEGAVAHIEALSQKYEGKPFRALKPGEIRVIFEIEPMSVSTNE